jgi:ankyrin repeat protein
MQGGIQSNAVRGEEDNDDEAATRRAEEYRLGLLRSKDIAMLRLLASYTYKVPVLFGGALFAKAAASGKTAVLRFLIEELGSDFHHVDANCGTPLFKACANAHLDAMRLLVNKFGADVDFALESGSTPIFIAAQLGYAHVVRCLGQELHADINKVHADGATPLYVAAQDGHLSVMRCLGELGARFNQANDSGCTPLHISAQQGDLKTVCCLVEELGADVNQADPYGVTPLLIAAYQGQQNVVKYMSKVYSLDTSWTTCNGSTPLLISAHEGHLNLFKYLLVEGVSITEADHKGRTLWDVLKFKDADHAELTASLLQTIVLLDEALFDFIAKFSTRHTEIFTRGRELRTKLPTYCEQQKASIIEHCPLPAVLQPIVAAYAVPTAEDVWTNGLRVCIVECSNSTCNGAGHLRCTACHQEARYCGQQCQRAHWTAHKVPSDCVWSSREGRE